MGVGSFILGMLNPSRLRKGIVEKKKIGSQKENLSHGKILRHCSLLITTKKGRVYHERPIPQRSGVLFRREGKGWSGVSVEDRSWSNRKKKKPP